jgi:hypothetical protein
VFGMTRKQFLKRSSLTLKDIGPLVLLLMEIIQKEEKGTIPGEEALKKLDIIRKDVEQVFFDYEKISPPSQYVTMHLKVLKLLTHFQEVVTSNQEYQALNLQGQKEADHQLTISKRLLEEFRQEFHSISREIELS